MFGDVTLDDVGADETCVTRRRRLAAVDPSTEYVEFVIARDWEDDLHM